MESGKRCHVAGPCSAVLHALIGSELVVMELCVSLSCAPACACAGVDLCRVMLACASVSLVRLHAPGVPASQQRSRAGGRRVPSLAPEACRVCREARSRASALSVCCPRAL